MTALTYASMYKHANIIVYLVSHGAVEYDDDEEDDGNGDDDEEEDDEDDDDDNDDDPLAL